MKPDEREDFIRDAEVVVAGIRHLLLALDRSEYKCGHCGDTRANNWTDEQVGRSLEAAITKVKKAQDLVGNTR